MSSLLSRIETDFDKFYGGRYLFEIIKEMVSKDWAIACALFSRSGVNKDAI